MVLSSFERARRRVACHGRAYCRHPLRRVHEREGFDALTRAALARGTRSCLCRPEQVRRHNAFHWTEHTLHAGGRPRNRTSTGWRNGHCRDCSHRGPDTSYHPWRPPHCEATAFTVTNLLRTSARPPTFGPANAMPASPPAQLLIGTRLASFAFRSSITRLRSPGGIEGTSRVRFGSFAVMIACAASISLCHSAW